MHERITTFAYVDIYNNYYLYYHNKSKEHYNYYFYYNNNYNYKLDNGKTSVWDMPLPDQ